MKYLPWILLIIGAIVVFLLWPQTGTSDREKELNQENVTLLYQIDSMVRWHEVRLKEMKQDSVRGIEVQDSLRTQGNAFKREAERFKRSPIIIKVREEVPEVDSLIVAQDSVIANQGYAIAAYEHQLGKLQINVGAITQNFEKALELERQRYANATEIIALKDKELKKEKKRKLVAKILVPISLVGGFLLGSQL